MSELAKLFTEFVEAHEEGRNPSLDDYVARAGSDGVRLRAMLDNMTEAHIAWQSAAKQILEHTLRLAREVGDVPGNNAASFCALLAEAEERVRLRDRCPRHKIAECVALAAGVEPGLHSKFRCHFHELKTGHLDPRSTTTRLMAAISSVLGIATADLLAAAANYRGPSTGPVLQFTRATGETAPITAAKGQPDPMSEQDCVDRLFFGDAPNV